jgi:hypothetical protein
MIAAAIKNNNYMPDKKENVPLALSGSLHTELLKQAHEKNLSKSEIAEFALRKLFGMHTDNCRNVLNIIYKQ